MRATDGLSFSAELTRNVIVAPSGSMTQTESDRETSGGSSPILGLFVLLLLLCLFAAVRIAWAKGARKGPPRLR